MVMPALPMGGGMPPMPPPGGVPPGIAGPMGQPPPTDPMGGLGPDPLTDFLGTIEQIVDTKGKQAASDMLSALPPDVLDELYRLIDEDVRVAIVLGDLLDPPERDPKYDGWYVEPPKPTRTEILDAANTDQGIWADVSDGMRDNLEWYNGEHPNTFKNFNGKKEDYFYDSAIRDDSDTKISILGNAPVNFEITYTEQEFEEPTQKAENALYYWMACWANQFAQANAGRSLRHEVEWYREVLGWVFAEVAVDLRGGKPLQHKLYDPTTCFPSWDEFGLVRLTRIYSDSVARVISAYDDVDGTVRKKIRSKVIVRDAKGERPADTTDVVTVTTYVDRCWRALFVNDIEIFITKHGYGVCPVVIGGSGLGEPMSLGAQGAAPGEIDTLSGDAKQRLRYKNPSGFEYRKRTHAQKEAVFTKMFNLFERIDRPDYMIEQDDYAEGEGVPQIKHGGNAVTTLKRGHETLTPLLQAVPPDFWTPMTNVLQQQDMTTRLPLAQHGVAQGSQQSGNATEGHIESGKDKFAVQLQAAEVFWGQWASLCLRLYRDFGHMVPNEQGEYGRQKVPYGSRQRWQHPDRPPAYELTPEMLDHIGTEVTAHMTSVRLQNLAPLGNAVAIWKAQRAMSSREGMELRGVRDPDMVFSEIDYEETLLDPDVQKIKRLQVLRKRDPAAASLYEQMIMGTGQPGASPAGGLPPGVPGQGGNNPDVNTSGMNLQALGMGQDGPTGRPSGPQALTPGAPPTGGMPPTF